MHRFFIEESAGAEVLELPAPIAHQVTQVLRFRPGQSLVLFSGDGAEYEYRLRSVRPALVERVDRREPRTECDTTLELGVALLKRDRLEWVVQKTTELGVRRIVLLETARCIPDPSDQRSARKLERLWKIGVEAVEQCGGVRLPELTGPVALADYLRRPAVGDRFILHPASGSSLPRSGTSVQLLVGPEGGFSEDEVALAREQGWQPRGLGTRILRAETAAVAAAAAVLLPASVTS